MNANDRYEELKAEAQARLAAKAASEPPQQAWTIQGAVKRHKLVTVLAAAGSILVLIIVLAASGGSPSPSGSSSSPSSSSGGGGSVAVGTATQNQICQAAVGQSGNSFESVAPNGGWPSGSRGAQQFNSKASQPIPANGDGNAVVGCAFIDNTGQTDFETVTLFANGSLGWYAQS